MDEPNTSFYNLTFQSDFSKINAFLKITVNIKNSNIDRYNFIGGK